MGTTTISGNLLVSGQITSYGNILLGRSTGGATVSISSATVSGVDNQTVIVGAGGGGSEPDRGARAVMYGNEVALLGGALLLSAGYSSQAFGGGVSILTSGLTRMMFTPYGHVIPGGAGTQNLGDATSYWNDISYKTLTDRGCLGWVGDGVELTDGRTVSAVAALLAIEKDEQKSTVYGTPMLKYDTFPRVSFKAAPVAEDSGEKLGQDGVEMTSLFSVMIGAIRELSLRVQALENKP